MTTVNIKGLARLINKQSGRKIKIQDAEKVIRELVTALELELDAGNVIKLGDLIKLSLEEKEAHKAYDGVHKRHYIVPKKRKLKVKSLTRIDNIENKDI